ncbi:MAG: cytochrome P450, partial [Pseudomonadota bacterium]
MLLENKWHKRIENQGRSIRPPVPPRRTESASVLELLSLYRSSMISVFSEPDFYRDIIHARFGWLDVYTLNTPELVREALQQNHKSLQAKTPQMRMALKPLLGDGLFISDRKIWETRRNIVGPIIHARNIKNFLPVMLEVVHEWRQNLQALGENAKIDMLSEMAELTAEVIARTVFGRRLGREYTAEIVKGFAEYQEHVDQLDYLSLIKAPDWIPRYQSRSAKRALRRVHRVIDLVVQEFAEGRGDENAVIADLFKAKDPAGKALTREAIRNEAIVIFMAGHETTANTLAWAWFLLSQCPRVREKFHKELDAQGLPETIEDVQKLIFTRALAEETLRMYPPVPILGRQALDNATVGGKKIKRGSVVVVCPYMLHRNPKVFSRPDRFIPERFDERLAPRPQKYSYVPFAIGPRICPGLVFGLTEVVVALSILGSFL